MDYEKELRKYKNKVENDAKHIRGLKEQIEGWKQAQEIRHTMVGATLMLLGADSEHAVEIKKIAIEHMLSECMVMAAPNDAGDGYLLHYVEKKLT